MISRKRANQIQMGWLVAFIVLHILHTEIFLDMHVTGRLILYGVVLSILAGISLLLIKNELRSQICYICCMMIMIHLMGTETGTLAYAIVFYMLAGTVVAISGNLNIHRWYSLIVNVAIFYSLITGYNIITQKMEMEYYVILVISCEVFLSMQQFMLKIYHERTEEMKRKNDLLAVAQKSKDEFLANMSHEIRTPMNAIIGTTELILRDEKITEKIKEHCYSIRSEGEILIAIIDDILDFSKLESGKMNILCEPYAFASLIQEVVNIAMVRRGFKDIEIIVDCSPIMPKQLIGDLLRVRQILMNIVINAVKYTEEGYIFITLSCYAKDGLNWLHMEVRDTGIGIKKEDQVHLFDSFTRLDTIRNRSIEGTGLGLALCKRLADAMNGTIQIQSEYGVGTTVYVDIPQDIEDAAPFLSIESTDGMKVVMYGDREQYEQKVHDFYHIANQHTWDGLGVSYQVILSFAELMREVEKDEITHLYTGVGEYIDQRNYFDNLAKKIKVFVMYDPRYPVKIGENVHGVHMPFYSINLATSLNGEAFYSQYIDKKEIQITFKAPCVRALIVDDNDVNLRVAEGVLKLYDINCVLAQSGKEAIELLKDQDIDIVFMDHMMPEMDGVETTKTIRRVGGEYAKHLPIVALTANAVNDARTFFLNNEFDDFVAKPVSLKCVDAVLRCWLPDEKMEWINDVDTKKESVSMEEVVAEDDVSDKTTFVSMQINAESALENMGNQRDLFKELLEYCLELEEQRKQEITKSFQAQDWTEYAIRVHGLKGSMRSLGVEELALVAQEQERAAKENRIEDVIAKHTHLISEYERGHRSIEAYLKTFQI